MGPVLDPETGLQYLRARYYDPSTGQFLSRDPLEQLTGQPYAYAGDNPTNYTDPSGLIFGISLNDVGNFFAGFGDTVTFGGTSWVRQQLGWDNVDYCSSSYGAGGVGALAVTALIPGEGEATGAEGVAGVITGYTRHGLAQTIQRDGGLGVSPAAILDAVRSPVSKSVQADGSTICTGQNAVVVVNGQGRVITIWPTNSAGLRNPP